ncbi:ribbon-helix-helix domain-containing protein [Argonema galeatum]|uniref:ribbon-helix-helix domain-containing protein n=1 Tax=Argonema galeatum TaxID=2942762 RepID=UPI002012A5ED|nr:CopG family transcriptional regulator [Argonema galeatum]MCL1466910.1 CopG family transcriptional regulator [Argonema galeatum A003/A1]
MMFSETNTQTSRASVGGKTDLAGVTAYIPKEWKAELEQWADEDDRSVSWLLSKLIEEALEQRRQNKKLKGKQGEPNE